MKKNKLYKYKTTNKCSIKLIRLMRTTDTYNWFNRLINDSWDHKIIQEGQTHEHKRSNNDSLNSYHSTILVTQKNEKKQ